MKKIFYSVFIISLFAVGIAHAEDGMMGGANQPTTTAINPTWLRIMPVMGSDTPKMMGGDKERRPMMGSSTQVCRKFSRGLALGLRGDDVKELQEMLRENGYLSASSTGYFGKLTKEAVVKFQKDGGVNPTGYFGELSRKQHDKRCGEGMGRPDDKRMGSSTPPMMWNASSTMPVPCFTNATTTGCDHSNAFKPNWEDRPCKTNFDPMTGKPCNGNATGTPPKWDDRPVACTMEARMCADGSMMPRDNKCGWHPEQCKPTSATTEQSSPCLGKAEGSSCQNGAGMCKYALGGDVLLFCVPVR